LVTLSRRRAAAVPVCGWFAAPSPLVRASVGNRLDDLVAMGHEIAARLLDFTYVPAGPGGAAAVTCRDGKTVQRAVRLRLVEGEPFSHFVTHVPKAIGRSYSRRNASTDLYQGPVIGTDRPSRGGRWR
jgi:GntR family transcriptional regulator